MARLVQVLVIARLDFAIRLGRNQGGFARLRQRLEHPLIRIVALISDDDGCIEGGQQRVGSFQIAGLTRRQEKAGRVAPGIHRGVKLGAQPAFASTNGLGFTLFF